MSFVTLRAKFTCKICLNKKINNKDNKVREHWPYCLIIKSSQLGLHLPLLSNGKISHTLYLQFFHVSRSTFCSQLIHSYKINITLFENAVEFESVAGMAG